MTTGQELQYVTLDVFTDKPYAGNQLGVVLLPKSVNLTDSQMQSIAKEFNYSETIILHDPKDPKKPLERDLRIFLTEAEVPFAGHPTIGAACFIGAQYFAEGSRDSAPAQGKLNTKVAPIPFTYDPRTKAAEISIPHDSHVHKKTFTPDDLKEHGFSASIADHAPPESPFVSIVKGMTFCLIKLPSLEVLSRLGGPVRKPQVTTLLDETHHPPSSGLAAYMFYTDLGRNTPDGPTRLRTRMIEGNFEDAATGSASAALAAYLALLDPQRESKNSGPRTFEMTQGVEMGRRSEIGVVVSGDQATSKVDTILLRGSAVMVMTGELIGPSA